MGYISGSSWITWGTETAQVELTVNECKPLKIGTIRAVAQRADHVMLGRGLHPSTLELNLSNSRTQA